MTAMQGWFALKSLPKFSKQAYIVLAPFKA
jgi:hypothetical protein